MGIVSFKKDSPGDIIYINDTPYAIDTSYDRLLKVGNRGDHIKSMGYISGNFYKLINDTLVKVRGDNIISSVKGVQSVLYDSKDKVCIFIKGKKVYQYFDRTGNIRDVDSLTIDGIVSRAFHPISGKNAVLEMSNGKLYFFYLEPLLQTCELPGSKCYLYKQYAPKFTEYNKSKYILLTDKGLYGLKYHVNIPGIAHFPIEEGNKKSLNGDMDIYLNGDMDIYELPLPDNISPEDIKDIDTGYKYDTLFVLINDGKVYSLGKNTYYQRGTTKKLDPHKWNQIEYPEPIKQIWAAHFPGLFAVSESGNLYYHGYNEGGYYLFTERKSNVSKPLKIAENVDSIFPLLSKVYGGGNKRDDCFCYFDRQGVPRILAGKNFLKVHSVEDHDFVYGLYQSVASSLVHTQPLIRIVLEHTC